jgi:hypothetical protein
MERDVAARFTPVGDPTHQTLFTSPNHARRLIPHDARENAS